MTHPWTPDGDGDCTHCPLPKAHPNHHQAAPGAVLPDPARLGVVTTPTQADTSQAAGLAAWPKAGTDRATILEAVAAAGEYGATDDDLAFDTDLSPNTVRPRRGELAAAGFLVAAREPDGTPRTRPNKAGNPCQVWVLTAAAREQVA